MYKIIIPTTIESLPWQHPQIYKKRGLNEALKLVENDNIFIANERDWNKMYFIILILVKKKNTNEIWQIWISGKFLATWKMFRCLNFQTMYSRCFIWKRLDWCWVWRLVSEIMEDISWYITNWPYRGRFLQTLHSIRLLEYSTWRKVGF